MIAAIALPVIAGACAVAVILAIYAMRSLRDSPRGRSMPELRGEVREAFEASWKRNEEGYRHLGRRTKPRSPAATPCSQSRSTLIWNAIRPSSRSSATWWRSSTIPTPTRTIETSLYLPFTRPYSRRDLLMIMTNLAIFGFGILIFLALISPQIVLLILIIDLKKVHDRFPPTIPKSSSRHDVELSDSAMQVVQDLAEETGSSPSDVLKNSVALYKLALDRQKAR
jgi:hypothetical protein